MAAREPGKEAATHVTRMTHSLKKMVAASRVGAPDEEANGSGHAVALHAANLTAAATALLALIHELRARNARDDVTAVDGEIAAAVAAAELDRRGRAADARAARSRAAAAEARGTALGAPPPGRADLAGDAGRPPFHRAQIAAALTAALAAAPPP